MDLINDQQAHFLDIGTVLPVTRDAVPLLWGADDDVSGQQSPQVRRVVPCQLHHLLAQPCTQTLAPIIHALTHQGLQGESCCAQAFCTGMLHAI